MADALRIQIEPAGSPETGRRPGSTAVTPAETSGPGPASRIATLFANALALLRRDVAEIGRSAAENPSRAFGLPAKEAISTEITKS